MPILDENSFEFISKSPEQTRRLGMRLGASLLPGDVICLEGDLGAGKTTFVQGAAQGWGSLDQANSPTFILINVYRRSNGSQLFHLDAYRIESQEEAEELDVDSMMNVSALLVEWAERISSILPSDRLWIKFNYESEEHRTLFIQGQGERHGMLLSLLRNAVYGTK